MRQLCIAVGLVACLAGTVMADVGDSWILPIADLQGGGWVSYPGAGYGGGTAWEGSGMDGVRRVYWKTDGTTMPTSTELYLIEVWGPTAGGGDWQPIESQFRGSAGETFPMEPAIPWNGAYGTNHEYIGSDIFTRGVWSPTGPGPHTPDGPAIDAGPNGIYMWLTQGSWLYAKWDFPWPITRTWSDIRITQITPEPATLLLLGLGGLFLRRKRSEV